MRRKNPRFHPHYEPQCGEKPWTFSRPMVQAVAVFKLTVNKLPCKEVVVCLTVSLISFFSSLPVELTCREDVLELWHENETVFRNAVETGDYGPVEELRGIQEVDVWEKGTNIVCGSTGISVSSHHYSILWLKNDFVPKPDAGWTFNGTAYELDDNNNTYVLEPLGDGFFYYEVHT